jgi:Dolichyl-phosphate-mannose-protein mannosyltransferase
LGDTSIDKPNEQNDTRLWPVVALLVLLAAALRFHLLGDKPLWADEAFLVNGANRSLTEILSYFLIGDLLSVLSTRVMIAIAGASEAILRIPSALAGTVAVGALYFALHRELGRKTAFIAAALLAVSFPHIYYSQEARSFAALTVWSALSLKATWDFGRTGDAKSAAWWALWMLLGINSHFLSVALFGYQLLYLWLAAIGTKKATRHFKALMALSVLFALAVSGSILLFNLMSPGAEDVHLQMPVTNVWGIKLWLLLWQFMSGAGKAAWPLLLLAAFGLLAGVRGKKMFFAGLLIVPFSLIAFASWHRHVGHAFRYDLFLIPAFMVLVAEGSIRLGQLLAWPLKTKSARGAKFTEIAVVVALAAGFAGANLGAYTSYLAFPAKYNWPVDWKAASEWLRNNIGEEEAVLLDPSGITLLSLPSLYRYYAEEPAHPPIYISGGDYRPLMKVLPQSFPNSELTIYPLESWIPGEFEGELYILLTFVDITVFDKLNWLRWWETGYIERINLAQTKFELLLRRTTKVKSYFGMSIIRVPFEGKQKLDSLINLTILPAYHRSLPAI